MSFQPSRDIWRHRTFQYPTYEMLASVIFFFSSKEEMFWLFFSPLVSAYWLKVSQPSVAVICPTRSRCIQKSGEADELLFYHCCSQSTAVCIPAVVPKWAVDRLISKSPLFLKMLGTEERRCFPAQYYLGKADFWVSFSSCIFIPFFTFTRGAISVPGTQFLGDPRVAWIIPSQWQSPDCLSSRTFRTGGRSCVSSDMAGRWSGLSVALA